MISIWLNFIIIWWQRRIHWSRSSRVIKTFTFHMLLSSQGIMSLMRCLWHPCPIPFHSTVENPEPKQSVSAIFDYYCVLFSVRGSNVIFTSYLKVGWRNAVLSWQRDSTLLPKFTFHLPNYIGKQEKWHSVRYQHYHYNAISHNIWRKRWVFWQLTTLPNPINYRVSN